MKKLTSRAIAFVSFGHPGNKACSESDFFVKVANSHPEIAHFATIKYGVHPIDLSLIS